MVNKILRYQVGNPLGQGAMATVYEAYDPSIDRQLAIKILREDRCVDNEYVMRFLREAKAIGNLSHPHIVTVYDVGEYENRPFIVMELLEGIPLNVLMRVGNKFPLKEALSIGIQLAMALDYAHSHGVVHRDIKPSNIICSQYDKKIKITDFGIAHFEDAETTQQTRMGDILGTPQYMPPEQLEGATVDGRSDLFSVGIILYQLLTGDRPFKGDSITSLMYQITTVEPKSIEEYVADVPQSINRIVLKLLSKDPDDRFQTGKDLADALTHALHATKDSGLEQRTQRIIPIRVKWSFLMASIVSIIMLTSIVFSFSKQYSAMTAQMTDYGNSLVKFVAAESAIPILSEDWVTIELFVKEASARQVFDYLMIVDHQGFIRGTNLSGSVGKRFERAPGIKLVNDPGISAIFKKVLAGSSEVVDFNAPISFQGKTIGKVHLGLPQASLQNLAKLTLHIMIALLVLTITVVVIFSYILGKYFSSSITVIRSALEEIISGRYHHRIEKDGNDEFSQLFTTFNQMAKILQKQQVHPPTPPVVKKTPNIDFPEHTKTEIISNTEHN